MQRRARTAAATTLLALCLSPLCSTPARADDASLWAAYDGRGSELNHALRVYDRASHRLQHSHGRSILRSGRAVIAANAGVNVVISELIVDMKGQPPSTDNGTKAKAFGLKGYRAWRLENVYEMRALQAYIDGRRHLGDVLYKRCFRSGKRAHQYLTRAEAAFKAAGFVPPKTARVAAKRIR